MVRQWLLNGDMIDGGIYALSVPSAVLCKECLTNRYNITADSNRFAAAGMLPGRLWPWR